MPAGKFVAGGVAGNNGLDGVYAVFQAVIYIYCYRWRELYEEDGETGEIVWLPQLNVIQRMAWSGLNPLAVITSDELADRSMSLLLLQRNLLVDRMSCNIYSYILYSKTMHERD